MISATRLLCRILWRRGIVTAANKTLPATLTCPCCRWQGRRFLDYIETGYTVPNAECPRCHSHSRHRALFVWLRDEYRIREKAGIALVFAPEKALAPLWQTAKSLKTYKVDLEAGRGVDVLADLLQLPFASEVANLIWCHHVLEQVEDDRVALRELYRVLSSISGDLIVSVGSGSADETVDFGFANKALSGNRRAFGTDFLTRLAEAGFRVEQLDYNLTDSECHSYGVFREKFFRCTRG